MLREIDDFVIEQLDKAVSFIEEWLFLSQKWLERGVLGMFLALSCVDVFLLTIAKHNVGWEVFADIVLFISMVAEHKQTKAGRTVRRTDGLSFRMAWFFMFGLFFIRSLITTRPMGAMYLYSLLTPTWFGIRLLMSYVTILDIEGLRGKAARLSWEKLKKLFGTSWVPAPQKG